MRAVNSHGYASVVTRKFQKSLSTNGRERARVLVCYYQMITRVAAVFENSTRLCLVLFQLCLSFY